MGRLLDFIAKHVKYDDVLLKRHCSVIVGHRNQSGLEEGHWHVVESFKPW